MTALAYRVWRRFARRSLHPWTRSFSIAVLAMALLTEFPGLAASQPGRLLVWGENPYNPAPAPSDLTNVTQVATGLYLNAALKADGSVVAWGPVLGSNPEPPPHFRDITSIAVGEISILGVRTNGEVVEWAPSPETQRSLNDLGSCVSVGQAKGFLFAQTADGTVLTWIHPHPPGERPVALPNPGPTQAISGHPSSEILLMLLKDGQVTRWSPAEPLPIPVPGLSNLVAISRLESEGFGLRADGVVLRWSLDAPGEVQVAGENATALGHGLAIRRDGTPLRITGCRNCAPAVPEWIGEVLQLASSHHQALAIIRDHAPQVLRQPRPQRLGPRQPLILTALVRASPPPTFQWYRDGVAIEGATHRVLAKHQPSGADSGMYHLEARNALGTVQCEAVEVVVLAAWPGPTRVVGWGAPNLISTQPVAVPDDLSDIVSIRAGGAHGIGLRAGGEVVVWGGTGEYGETLVPRDLTNVVAVSAGRYHNLALRADGTIAAWGFAGWGQTTVPEQATNIVAIAAGGLESYALRADGKVFGWGLSPATLPGAFAALSSYAGQPTFLRQDGTWSEPYAGDVEAGAIQAVGADDHILSLRSDGGVTVTANQPMDMPEWLTDAIQVSAHAQFGLALRRDGRVVAWGVNGAGRTVVPSGLAHVVEVAAGATQAYALGVVSAPSIVRQPVGGSIPAGQRLVLTAEVRAFPAPEYQWFKDGIALPGATGAAWVIPAAQASDAGTYTLLAKNSAGTATSALATVSVTGSEPPPTGLIVWSSAGLGTAPVGIDPVGFSSSRSLTADRYAFALLRDGSLIRWRPNAPALVVVTGRTDVVQIAGGLALLRNGSIYSTARLFPFPHEAPASPLIPHLNDAVALSENGSLIIRADGTVFPWAGLSTAVNARDAQDAALGLEQIAVLRTDGTVASLPIAASGIGKTNGLHPPPAGLTGLVKVVGFADGFLALQSDGTLVAWGDESSGFLPLPAHLTRARDIRSTAVFPVVLTPDGDIYVFTTINEGGVTSRRWVREARSETEGALGIGASTDFLYARVPVRPPSWILAPASISVGAGDRLRIPVNAQGNPPPQYQWFKDGEPLPGSTAPFLFLAQADSADAGSYHVVARNDGGSIASESFSITVAGSVPTPRPSTVVGWGRSRETQTLPPPDLGNVVKTVGGETHSLALLADRRIAFWGKAPANALPDAHSLSPGVIDVAAGRYHSIAVLNTGVFVGWGSNSTQQLDPAAGATELIAAAAGDTHSLVLRADGTVIGWGAQVPFSSGTVNPASVVPRGLTNVVAIAAGAELSMALKSDGTVTVWGASRVVPAQATNITRIAAGAYHCMALRSDGTVLAWAPLMLPDRNFGQHLVPTNLPRILRIAAGRYHSMALTETGEVIAWGAGAPGKTGPNDYGQSSVPSGLRRAYDLGSGTFHGLALVPTVHLAFEEPQPSNPTLRFLQISGEPRLPIVVELSHSLESWLPLQELEIPDNGVLKFLPSTGQDRSGFFRARLR